MLPVLGALAGSALAPTLGVSALTAGAIGSGLGGFVQSGDLGQGIMTGLGSYATGGMYGKLAGAGPLAEKSFMGIAAPQLAQMAGTALGGAAMMPQKPIIQQRSGANAQPYGSRLATPPRQRIRTGTNIKGFQAGGIASVVAPQELNDKELILEAVKAFKGQVPREQGIKILSEVAARFGEEAVMDLAEKTQKGAIAQTDRPSEGRINGAGDGMDDMVPANLEGQEDILLSQDEYILPADFVSHVGNGSSEAGAKKIDRAIDDVRMQRTGTTQQAPQIDGDAAVQQMMA